MNGRSARLEDCSARESEQVVATNLLSMFYTIHTATPLMRAQGSGAIVNAGSTASLQAVEGMTKALGVEWAPHGMRVNAVAPTFVLTPLTRPMFEDEAFAADVMRRLPTSQLATVQQVADAVRYLPSTGRERDCGHCCFAGSFC